MTYLEKRRSSGCRAVEAEQRAFSGLTLRAFLLWGRVAWGELYGCFQLEDSGASFIESVLVNVFIPIDF